MAASGSPRWTLSPARLYQRATVPSTSVSASFGMRTSIGASGTLAGLDKLWCNGCAEGPDRARVGLLNELLRIRVEYEAVTHGLLRRGGDLRDVHVVRRIQLVQRGCVERHEEPRQKPERARIA